MDYLKRREELQNDIAKIKQRLQQGRNMVDTATQRIHNLSGALQLINEIIEDESDKDGE